MGNKRNKKNGKNKSNKKQLQNIDIQKKIEKQQKINKLLEEKYITSKLRARNFNDISRDILKAAWFVILGLATLGIVIFLILAGMAYIKGNSAFANITMTIMQSLTGVVSVIVGIWALILTIEANRKESSAKDKLNINQSSSGVGVVGVPHENDVNPKSLE